MLRRKPKYLIILEDEAHLQNVGRWYLTPWKIAGLSLILFLIALILGFLLFLLTPIKTLLPGYLKQSERVSSEQTMLRLDSLQNVFNQNEIYLNNILTVLDTERHSSDSTSALRRRNFMTLDSLQGASSEEKKFLSAMQDKHRYNISVVAPLAAESMLFYSPAEEAVISASTRSQTTAKVIFPVGVPVGCIADGTIISAEKSGDTNLIVVQHSKGFLSRYRGTGMPLVAPGDHVDGGQAIALPPPHRKGNPPFVELQMWHNGNELVPYEFISPHASPTSLLTSEISEMQ
ncbi:MAG: M23 family metallopeptidase [Muribaculaceae bacterium]|nr:M23 family metallopeptidase [Muribaculaceae bacterium]